VTRLVATEQERPGSGERQGQVPGLARRDGYRVGLVGHLHITHVGHLGYVPRVGGNVVSTPPTRYPAHQQQSSQQQPSSPQQSDRVRSLMMVFPSIDICRYVAPDIRICQYVSVTTCCSPIFESPLAHDEAAALAGKLRALSDPARLRLLSLIARCGDVCACEPVETLGLSQPTVSHHLKVLHDAGLLERERRGRWIHYRVVPDAITAIVDALAIKVESIST